MTKKYQHRPAEELYDVENDPQCLHNLIEDLRFVELKAEFSNQLDIWMKSQGDMGAATEAMAHTRKSKFKDNRRPNR